jgi:outer membrane autotransporter protein
MRGVEIGRDNPQSFADGKKYTGFVLGTGRAGNTFAAGGGGATDSFYAGAYGSWLRDDGAFFDIVGKYNWFSHSFDTPVFGGGRDSGSYRNTGLGLSAEIGKRFERGHGAFIQPEAELSALWAGRASYATANGLAVETPAADSLQLRLGVTAGRKWQDAGGAAKQVYGKAGWVNEYRGGSTVRVDGAAFDASLKGHQWVAGVGYIEDNGRRQLYLDVEKSWGDTVSKSWGVNAGCRWKF